jgi:hypothetical protein
MCKCREKNKAKASAGDSLMEMFMAAKEPLEFVSLDLNEAAVLGSKVFVPARIDRVLRGASLPHYKNRMLTLVSHQQEVPVEIRDWMRQDFRYRGWFKAVPVSVQALELLETEDDETLGGDPVDVVVTPSVTETPPVTPEPKQESETPPVQDDPKPESIFDLWGPDEIEEANLTGEEGLLAYAAYHHIDLGDATLKADVMATILEWYDANLD